MDEIFRQMRERQEMIRRLSEGPLGDPAQRDLLFRRVNEVAEAINAARASEHAIAALTMHDVATRIQEGMRETERTFALMRTQEFRDSIERALDAPRQMAEMIDRMALSYRSLDEQIQFIATRAAAAIEEASRFDFSRFATLIDVPDTRRLILARRTETLLEAHAGFVGELAEPESPLQTLPAPAASQPTIGLFVHTGALRSLTPHEPGDAGADERRLSLRVEIADETVLFLEQTLPELHPAFLDQYRGARARAADRGPDWWTQGSSSMRKLLKGVLHTAAPSAVVAPWARERGKEFDRNGNPTRETKLDWLCEPARGTTYREFVRAELQSALALIKIVDTAQHVDEFPDFERQYNWVMLRSEVAIRQILILWKMRR